MLYQEIGHQPGVANQLGNLGIIHYLMGNLSTALEFYERALRIHREVSDPLGEAMDLGNIGETYRLLGNPERAREYQLQALDVHRELEDKRGEAATVGTLGLIEQVQGHLPQARAYFEEALDLHRQLGDLSGQSRDLIHVGNVHRQLGELARARACCEEALTLSRKAGYQRDEASAMAGLGLVCQELGDLIAALAYQTQALNLADQLGTPELAWRFLGARGDVQRLQLLYELAYQDYRAAIELIESMRSRLTLEEHRLGFVTEVRESTYTRMITLLADREGRWNSAEALLYVERAKSRVFLEQLATTSLPAPAGITHPLLDQERQLIQRLSGLIASRRTVGVANPELNDLIQNVEGELRATWEMLETVVPEYVALRRGTPVSARELQRYLIL
jgi:tetratricopeptide (TPR) repeat protein